ncbi:hypothetical protein [Silanimonas sp.]|uniref:hypothetical protein n=1 Tax=Silanimonas sp. TaxID=1929290 RepID=UPI0022C93070|nr:hypothetical protein [Silanimonas sp.]MCZ8116190.1 hypothetical protein [Silanimonas sp.]
MAHSEGVGRFVDWSSAAELGLLARQGADYGGDERPHGALHAGEYGLDMRVAALLAACISLPGGVLRAVGGWLPDRLGAHAVT